MNRLTSIAVPPDAPSMVCVEHGLKPDKDCMICVVLWESKAIEKRNKDTK